MGNEEELVQSLKTGKITARDLSSGQFEDVVAFLIKEHIREKYNKETINISTNKKKGPIDIVIEQKINSIEFGDCNPGNKMLLYYVECKNYGRTVEFDRAAKSYVVAITDQPSSLIIVTPKNLQPQAIEYARKLFSVENPTQGASPLFRSVDFRVVALGTLVGKADVDAPFRAAAYRRPHLVDWCLSSIGPYGSATLASSATAGRGPAAVAMSADNVCSLTAHVSWGSDPIAEAEAYELIGADIPAATIECRRTSNTLNRLRIDVRVPPGQGVTFMIEGLRVRSNGCSRRLMLGLPVEVHLVGGNAILGDARAASSESWAKLLMPGASQCFRILCIHGEAGLGKSYLCEQVVRRLKEKAGVQGHRFVANTDGASQLLLRMVWALINPFGDEGGTIPRDGPVAQIGTTVLRRLAGVETEEAIQTVLAGVAKGQVAERATAVLIEGIAACLPLMSIPQVLVVQNAHDFSYKDIILIDRFLRRLQEADFHNVRIIFESRDEPGMAQTPWASYVEEDMTGLEQHVRRLKLEPLGAEAVRDALHDNFLYEDTRPLVDALMRKCGGNPLFVEQILQDFRERGVIETVQGLCRVVDFPRLTRALEQVPSALSLYLSARLSRITARIDARVEQPGATAAFLKILAALERPPDPVLYRNASGLSDSALFDIRIDLQSARVLVRSGQGNSVFVHALLEASALGLDNVPTETNRIVARYVEEMRTAGLLGGQSFESVFAAGRLSKAIGDLPGAEIWLDEARKIAEAASNFFQLRRALETGLALRRSADSFRDDLSTLLLEWELAYVELQSGSQHKARRLFQAAIAADTWVGHTPDVRRLKRGQALEALRHVMAIDIRLADPLALFDHAGEALTSFEEAGDLSYTLSRLLLAAIKMNCVSEAQRAATLAWALLSLLNQDNSDLINRRASLLSDIGQFYLVENPDQTHAFWSEALALQPSGRQLVHALTNVRISNALLDPGDENTAALAEHTRYLKENGHDNPLIRANNALGIMEWRRGDRESAVRLWRTGLSLCQTTGHDFFQWLFYNNLGIAALCKGQAAEGHKYLKRAFQQSRGYLMDSAEAHSKLESLMARAEERIKALFGVQSQGDETLALPPIAACGDLCRLRWNFDAIGRADRPPKKTTHAVGQLTRRRSHPNTAQPVDRTHHIEVGSSLDETVMQWPDASRLKHIPRPGSWPGVESLMVPYKAETLWLAVE